jgi:spore coat polysaccharide biosynthesis protein SpsF
MVAIITQARVNSTRLPNKIFLEANHQPFLYYHINRLKKTGLPIFVATTNNGSESPIVDYCNQQQVACFCGDELNVLERFYTCAEFNEISTIIRVTSDCPLIDPQVITNGLALYKECNDVDVYCSNVVERTFPRGMDFEIFSFEALKEAYHNATAESDKEHVTPYIRENKAGNIVLQNYLNKQDDSGYRLTLDTEEDRVMLTALIEDFNGSELDTNELVAVLKNNSWLSAINAHVEQKKI